MESTNRTDNSKHGYQIPRALWPEVDAPNSSLLLRMGRRSLRSTIGIIQGHWIIRYMLNKMERVIPVICRFYEEVNELKNIGHMKCHYPSLMVHRARCLRSYFNHNIKHVSRRKLQEIIRFIMGYNGKRLTATFQCLLIKFPL